MTVLRVVAVQASYVLMDRERVRVYDGSGAEWGRMPDAPVERA